MENPFKKRLGVFRGITRDLTPDSQTATEGLSIPQSEVTPLTIDSNPYLLPSSEILDSPHRVPHKPPFVSGSTKSFDQEIPKVPTLSIKKPRECQISYNPQQSLQRKLLTPRDFRRVGDMSFDTSMNSSGNFSLRSLINISTEESSREDEERKKPKKRPLEEGEKKFYVIRLDVIANRKDTRTTVMIKNIPNKYTQKMLLQTIDKKFAGTYDFLYLPIDFKARII